MAQEQTYPIKKIVRDDYFKVRPLNRERVEEYKEQKQAGDVFPPVVLWHESGSGHVYLVAGEHRLTADEELGRENILAIFMNFPSKLHALEFAISDNAKHGLPFTAAERRAMVERLLTDPESTERSDRHIARTCHVDHKTVGRLRAQLEASGEIPQSTERVGADGITRSLPTPKPAPEPEPPTRLTEATIRERFPLDTRVRVEGSDVIGVVTDIGGVYRGQDGKVCVTRPNPNSPGVNMTHWVDASKVTVVDDDPPGLTPAEVEKMNADLAADMAALHGQTPPAVAKNATTEMSEPLKGGEWVRNKRNGQEGEIVGFQGNAAFVKGVNGKHLVGLPFLERVNGEANPIATIEAPSKGDKHPAPCGWPDYLCTCDIVPEQVAKSADPMIDEWAGDSPSSSAPEQDIAPEKPRALDEIAPRPWSVKQGVNPFIVDAKGKHLASIYFNQGIDRQIADVICGAVNVVMSLPGGEQKDLAYLLRRILTFAATGDVESVTKQDFHKAFDWLYRVESKFYVETHKPGEQPQPASSGSPVGEIAAP